jgi:phosphate transport system ATP-binding protein
MPQSAVAEKTVDGRPAFVQLDVLEGNKREGNGNRLNAAHYGHFVLEDVSVSYGDDTVLEHVNLDIPAGSVTAFIGPSGCGKSTLLRCLNRMNDEVGGVRVGGRILLDGRDIYAPDMDLTALRMQVGQVFQHHCPFPFSIYDNIAFGPRLLGMKNGSDLDETVVRALKEAALYDEVSEKLDAPATSLSGGQQQRLCIARSLAMRPKVLLMDEPCSALDPISTEQIEETIRSLAGHVTVVIVTHSMQQAARVSDQTAFILRADTTCAGTLVEAGPTEKIFSDPDDQRTKDYLDGCFG